MVAKRKKKEDENDADINRMGYNGINGGGLQHWLSGKAEKDVMRQ